MVRRTSFLRPPCLLMAMLRFDCCFVAIFVCEDELRKMDDRFRALVRLTARCAFRCSRLTAVAGAADRPDLACAASTPPPHSAHARNAKARTVTAIIGGTAGTC